MGSKTFEDIARKYSQTVKLPETASPELWAAKLKDELAAQQRKLQETNPRHLLYFALEKQCLELEEAIQILGQESQPAAQPPQSDKIRRIQEDLAAKRSELQNTSPQSFIYFALEKQCQELEANLQDAKQEVHRKGQARLLENMRQAIHYGDKDVYESLFKGTNQALLPTKDEAEYASLLEIQKQAANKQWPAGSATPPSSKPIAAAQRPPSRPPPPAPPPSAPTQP